MMKTWAENLHDEIDGQSAFGSTWNTLKSFIPLYSEYNLRGNVRGVGFFAGGFGKWFFAHLGAPLGHRERQCCGALQ
jgi:hypothetical protein